jgi:four helix bundle protein
MWRTMRNDIDAFERRTKNFAIAAIRLCAPLEQVPGMRFLGGQLARSAGSVASNHRAMRRSRSTREFAAKLQIVNEEIDESVLWLEIVDEIVPDFRPKVTPLLTEGVELRSMFAAARATTRRRLA